MPTVSRFFGLTIRMYVLDHVPPHFHAKYNEDEAQINIETLQVIKGSLPGPQLALAVRWGAARREELRKNWELATASVQPLPIAPLTHEEK